MTCADGTSAALMDNTSFYVEGFAGDRGRPQLADLDNCATEIPLIRFTP
jgi:hypothetical protein